MSVTVTVEWQAKPGNGSTMRQAILEVLPETRSYKGCQWLELVVNQDDPNNFIVWERWDTRANYEAYLKWRVDKGVVSSLGSLAVRDRPNIRFYDTVKEFP